MNNDPASVPNILEQFAADLRRTGVAGEVRVAKLLYLAMTSRLLDRPVSIIVKGPSSAGKSFLVERVLKFFPPEAYHTLTAMSEHALVYTKESFEHRMLILYEAAGLDNNFAAYLVRSLLSEGQLRYETVEKTSHGLRVRVIEKRGPTGLLATTTVTSVDPELETRLLSVLITDTQDQTRHVLRAIASEKREPVDLELWRTLQQRLLDGEHRVTIPFAVALADLIDPAAVRLRRDFGSLLALIRTHALLQRDTRQTDDQAQIIATLDDYGVVRDLVADLVAEGVETEVSAVVRETVDAVRGLLADRAGESHNEGVSQTELMKVLRLGRTAVSRRVALALDLGYLHDLESRKGRPARLVLGDPLPEDRDILPSAEALRQAIEPPPSASDKGERIWLWAMGQTLGFPALSDGEGEVTPGGVDSWKQLLSRAPDVQVARAIAAVYALEEAER